MNRKEILKSAERCVCTDRQSEYGDVEDNFSMIAKMWSIYTGAEIDAKDVATMMALLKIARIKTGVQKSDSWVDLAGYAACGGEISTGTRAKDRCMKENRVYDCYYCQKNSICAMYAELKSGTAETMKDIADKIIEQMKTDEPDIRVDFWKCSKCRNIYDKYPDKCPECSGALCFYPFAGSETIRVCDDCQRRSMGRIGDEKCAGCDRYEVLKKQ